MARASNQTTILLAFSFCPSRWWQCVSTFACLCSQVKHLIDVHSYLHLAFVCVEGGEVRLLFHAACGMLSIEVVSCEDVSQGDVIMLFTSEAPQNCSASSHAAVHMWRWLARCQRSACTRGAAGACNDIGFRDREHPPLSLPTPAKAAAGYHGGGAHARRRTRLRSRLRAHIHWRLTAAERPSDLTAVRFRFEGVGSCDDS